MKVLIETKLNDSQQFRFRRLVRLFLSCIKIEFAVNSSRNDTVVDEFPHIKRYCQQKHECDDQCGIDVDVKENAKEAEDLSSHRTFSLL